MAMLAERKRKQKWSLNPRGKDWVEDSNKFGQKMLEKMGWSSGKGLGAKENGITEHIKVSYKNDSKGMGYKESNDQWTEHETNFSALLESLTGQDADISKVEKPVETSLEKKSQSSKARVHYHKFTRGKDLSRYSEKDLANIFGKKTLKDKKNKKIEEITEENTSKIEENSSFHFNRGSMTEYFKKKLPNFGKNNNLVIGNNGVLKYNKNEEEEENYRPSFGFGFNTNEDSQEENKTTSKEEESSKSKKKMTFVSYVKSTEEEEVKEETPKKRKLNDTEETTPKKKTKIDREDTPKEKKKKKKKSSQIEENLGLSNPAFDPLYNNVKIEKHNLEIIEEIDEETKIEETAQNTEKPKKKKKKSLNINEEFETIQEEINEESQIEESSVKLNKKKKKSQINNMNSSKTIGENIEEIPQKSPKKKKTKSKNEEICFENTAFNENLDESSAQIEENPYEVKKKNKKKRKIEETGFDNPNLAVEDSVVIEVDEEIKENPYEVKIKKKKNKKSKKNFEENGLDNPNFSIQASAENEEMREESENPYEVKIGKKKKGKIKEEMIIEELKYEEIKENLPECNDLILNIAVIPIIKKEESRPKIVRNSTVKRRKSVRFSDVNEEHIIPNKEEMQMLEETNELFDINTRVITNGLKENDGIEDTFDMSSIDRLSFYEQPREKKKKGLQNEAFNDDYSIEENVSEMAKTMDNFQAEIDNSINEEKLKSIELEDIMVGDVSGGDTGKHEKTPEGTKLKFYRASFGKSISYFNNQVGPKKSYKHLIKGDITLAFKNTNLHTIEGYATKRID